MSKTFETVLNLNLLHDYYSNGFTADFLITPTAATRHFLKRNRLLFKNTAYGCLIACDDHTLTTLPGILAEKTLGFILKLKNKNSMNFTDLPTRSNSKDSYYLSCVLNGDAHVPMEALTCYPPVFTYPFTAAGAETDLEIEDPAGNTVFNETFAGTGGEQLNASVNLEGYAPGVYSIIIEDQLEETIYIGKEPVDESIFGIAEITLGDFTGFDPDTHQAYQYEFQFNAKTSAWEYHLSFSKDYLGYTFTIDDTEGGIVFTETVAPVDYSEGSLSVFTAQTNLSCAEAARKGLQLSSENTMNEVTVLYEDLPNPEASNPESKVYITI